MATVTAVTKAALQSQIEALRHNCNLIETERDALRAKLATVECSREALSNERNTLRAKLDARNQDLIGLNEAYSIVTTRLDVAEHLVQTLRAENNALHNEQRPSRSEVPSTPAAQISARRAAMQRAREEAMATGRYVKV